MNFSFPNGFYWSQKKLIKFEKFAGIVAAVLTPFNSNGSLKLNIVQDYADDLESQGIKGIFVTGTAGESQSLTVNERKMILEAWMQTKQVKGKKLFVMAHIGGNCQPDTAELAKNAEKVGADSIVLMPPYFFKPKNEEQVIDWIESIAKEIPTMPIFYYHIPSFTGVNISPQKMVDLIKPRVPSFVGIKFTNTDMFQLGLCANRGMNMLVGGDEYIYSALSAGAHGAIGLTFSLMGNLHVRILNAFNNDKFDDAAEFQRRSREAILMLVDLPGETIAKTKYLVKKARGLDLGTPRIPIPCLSDEDKNIIDKHYKKLMEYLK